MTDGEVTAGNEGSQEEEEEDDDDDDDEREGTD